MNSSYVPGDTGRPGNGSNLTSRRRSSWYALTEPACRLAQIEHRPSNSSLSLSACAHRFTRRVARFHLWCNRQVRLVGSIYFGFVLSGDL